MDNKQRPSVHEPMRTYVNGRILDGTENMEEHPGVVVTEGDRIVDISSTAPQGCETVDLDGAYIMPGLVNMHVHLAGNGKPQKKQRDNEKLVKTLMGNGLTRAIVYKMVCGYAEIELMSGVTTIRTMGGFEDYDTRCRNQINAGDITGPRILASNQGISVPGGHMAGSVAVAEHSIPEALLQVDIARSQGVDLIKLMVTGGVLDAKEKGVPGELKMQPEMIRAVCDKAHSYGLMVAAHTESPDGVRVALENGVDSIEHGAKTDDYIIDLYKEHESFVCTTLSPALPYALMDCSITNVSEVEQFNGNVVFEGIIDNAKAALAAGVPVALGNDVGCPWVTQYDFWRELVYFKKFVGVDARFALHTATLRNAELAGLGAETGSIEVGKCADMIVTKGNPLDDLSALRDVVHVVSAGKLIANPKVKRNSVVDRHLDPFTTID